MTVAILGAGKIGEALLSGLLRSGQSAADLVLSEQSADRAAWLTEKYGVEALSNPAAAARADVVVVAVKPYDVTSVLDEVSGSLAAGVLVVSVAAGIPTAVIEEHLPAGTAVVRVMPNTPMLVGEAMSVLAPGAAAGPDHLDRAEALMSPVGRVLRVAESQLDAVTAVSGSGPAYFFLLVEAMVDAGVLLGLPRALAAELAVQTAVGSATLLRDGGDTPAQLREAVTSPGGTTAAALRELEKAGLRAAVIDALEACRDRARALAG